MSSGPRRSELRWVKRRPSAWRWAVVALYNALGHALANHRPANHDSGVGQLVRLFDAVAREHLEIAGARQAVGGIERLRCQWITRAVTSWPIPLERLPGLFEACRAVLVRLSR